MLKVFVRLDILDLHAMGRQHSAVLAQVQECKVGIGRYCNHIASCKSQLHF